MKTNINIVRSLDQFIRQLWSATGTEDDSSLAESGVDPFIPPASMTKFHDVPTLRVELRNDSFKTCRGVLETGRKLKKETTHPGAKHVGDVSEIAHQRFCPRESFNMSDELRDFDRVDKLTTADLTLPGFHCSQRGPGIKRRVELNGPEPSGIVRKPFVCWQIGRIEHTSPIPVKPSGTADVEH